MRMLSALSLVAAAAISGGQTRWHHELLYQTAFGEDMNYGLSKVDAAGVPYFTAVVADGGLEHVFRYKTDLNATYIPEISHGLGEGINSSGQVQFYALTLNSYHEMVDGRDYFTECYGQTLDYMPTGYGVDDAGRPFWLASGMKAGTKPCSVYRGSEEISQGMQLDNVRAWKINRCGDVLWDAHQATDPAGYNRALYLNTTNLSGAILGPGCTIVRANVNDKGEAFWSGTGANTGYKTRIYLGRQDITPAGLTYSSVSSWFRTNSGYNLWTVTINGQKRLMRDDVDLSSGFFDGSYQIVALENPGGLYIAENGDVAWQGVGNVSGVYRRVVFKNRNDISDPALGQFTSGVDDMNVRGIDDAGNVLWDGSGSNTGHVMHTFVNGFDLSADAWPNGGYDATGAMAAGPNGSVLWVVGTGQGGNYMDYIYLSTPVPEPSGLLSLLPVILLGAIRRRHRVRTGV